MRVLFIEEGHGVGGSVISLYYLMRGLAARGVEGVAWFPAPHAWSERFAALGVEVVHGSVPPPGGARAGSGAGGAHQFREGEAYRRLSFYKSHWSNHPREVRDWRQRLEAIRPHVVYGNNSLPLNMAVLTAGSELGLGVVAALRGLQPLRAPHRAFRERLALGVAISEMVRAHYLAAGFSPERIVRVYNGVALEDYPFREPRTDVPADGGRILFLGRLTGWKGADVLLRAAARLATRRPALSITVAGDGPARTDWERTAASLGLADRIRFVGFRPDVVPLLADADLLVHASTAPEPFGRVLVEGMAAGVPVVASDHGAAPEIIDTRVTGWLAPPGDVDALAEVIDEALAAGARRTTMARAARARVESDFTVERTADAVHRLLGSGKMTR